MRVAAVAASLAPAHAAFAAPSLSDPSLAITTYLTASFPTGIRFTGPDEGFLIEKGGVVKRFAGGTTSTVLDLQVADGFEQGLLSCAGLAAIAWAKRRRRTQSA